MQLRDVFLVHRDEAVRVPNDVEIFYHARDVVQDAEEKEPDGDELHDGDRAADVVCELVVRVRIRRKRRRIPIVKAAPTGRAGVLAARGIVAVDFGKCLREPCPQVVCEDDLHRRRKKGGQKAENDEGGRLGNELFFELRSAKQHDSDVKTCKAVGAC